MLERVSSNLRYSNPLETFNWSPVLSKNPAVYTYVYIYIYIYIYMHIIILIIVMNDSFVLMHSMMQCINSAQFTFYSSLVLCAKCHWEKMVILPRKVWLHRRTDTKTSFHVSHKTCAYF